MWYTTDILDSFHVGTPVYGSFEYYAIFTALLSVTLRNFILISQQHNVNFDLLWN